MLTFEAALDTCNIKAHEAIHVGDNPEHDIIGAGQVGRYTVWLNPERQVWPKETPPHKEIYHLQKLINAQAIQPE